MCEFGGKGQLGTSMTKRIERVGGKGILQK